jgi:hypothetical protein
MTKHSGFQRTGDDAFGSEAWEEKLSYASALTPPLDKYDIATFARDDPRRFLELVQHLSPRDQEIMLCFAVLQKRTSDLSVLFGKAGHRAEEDLQKAAHKLAGLAEFSELPNIERIGEILKRQGLETFNAHSLAPCIWQYARCRDFAEVSRLIGGRGLRQHMLRAFKILHAAEGREEGLLAGWILWLVDGSDPKGKGWRKRKRGGREHKLGPTVFHCSGTELDLLQQARRATQKGGQRQRTKYVKIQRRMKFVLRGMNA